MKINKILQFIISLSLLTTASAKVLTFSEAYELTLNNLDEIKSLDYQLKANKEKINQSISKLYPQINFSLTKSSVEYEKQLSTSNTKENSLDANLYVSQTIYNHSIYKSIEYEKIKHNIDKLNFELEKQNVLKDLFNVYIQLFITNIKIQMLKSNLDLTESKFKSTSKKFELNLVNKIDYLDSKIEYENALIEFQKEKNSFNVYKKQITKYVGIENFDLPYLDYKVFNESFFENFKQNLSDLDKINQNNLKLQILNNKVLLAKSQLKLAKSGHYPTLDLSLSYTDFDSNETTTDYKNYQKLMFTLNLPLYQGGSTNSKIREAKQLLFSTKSDFEAEKKNLDIEYQDFYIRFLSSIKQLDSYLEAIKSSELYEESISQALDKGLKSKIDLYDAKFKLNQLKQGFIDNLAETIKIYIELSTNTNKIVNTKDIDTLFSNQ